MTIDLGQFGTMQRNRIDYIKDRSQPSLTSDLHQFRTSVNEVYERSESKNYTADIWGFLQQGINQNDLQLSGDMPVGAAVENRSRNILIILTDGYLEVAGQHRGSCDKGPCRLLNTYQMANFRRVCACENDPYVNLDEVLQGSGLGITPVNNPALTDVEVLLLELYDRSRTKSGRITVVPSDFQIMETYWMDFFRRSGVKRARVVETAATTADIETTIRDFIQGHDPDERATTGDILSR